MRKRRELSGHRGRFSAARSAASAAARARGSAKGGFFVPALPGRSRPSVFPVGPARSLSPRPWGAQAARRGGVGVIFLVFVKNGWLVSYPPPDPVTGHSRARLSICLAVRLSGCPAVLLSCCPAVRLSGCPAVRLSGCPAVRLSGCPVVRLSCCPAIRLSCCPVVWLSCCPVVRLSGPALPQPRRTGSGERGSGNGEHGTVSSRQRLPRTGGSIPARPSGPRRTGGAARDHRP